MPLIATRGAASAQGFGEFAQSAAPVYIEDVFSTYLYTGNGSTQTITNNIDLSGEGGLVWVKSRGIEDHTLSDTARGVQNFLRSNTTGAQSNSASALTAFNTDGFSVGNGAYINANAVNYASWTFRKAEKFFDVVTWTGTGSPQNINHNLGSTPGCIMIKSTSISGNWWVWHRSLPDARYGLYLNGTGAQTTSDTTLDWTDPTSTNFRVGTSALTNSNGATYVAYLFAHDAGGFGTSGTDNVISCGSYTGNGSATGPTISLGYEPQWVLIKRTDTSAGWFLGDIMRGMSVGNGATGNFYYVNPNNSNAEDVLGNGSIDPTPTGFTADGTNTNINANGGTYIYIAIRRGPMKTPTSGTEVFYPYVTASVSNVGSTSGTMYNSQIVTDHAWQKAKGGTDGWYLGTRLTGTAYLKSETTAAESTSAAIVWDSNRGAWAFSDPNYGLYCFKRAPGFFDVVCYTGTGSARTVSHNLGVVPEMMIVKSRNGADSWIVYHSTLGATKYVLIDGTGAAVTDSTMWNNTAPTASVFSLGASPGTATNLSGTTYVAYLFATVAGVSKVGSYTGTGALLTVDCGFTGGARFVMIRRTSTGGGDWWVYDSARGISSGNDPYLFLNSTAAEVTNTNYVDTTSVGFQVTAAAPAGLNANGGTFIFLAVA